MIIVKGYKVFNPDWTCSPSGNTKQYICPGKFEEEVELEIGKYGMHFCEDIKDCFTYYDFDSDNKVAEVIAYGKVLKENDISCTNKLEIIREISWEEVLSLVNIGKNCTGCGNIGDYNIGDYNIGIHNTGDYNIGDRNKGYYNTGKHNTGDCNTGDWNIGSYNVGDWNEGNHNVGDFNKTSFNTGCFMTKEKKISMFNKPSDWTYLDWITSKAHGILNSLSEINIKHEYSLYITNEIEDSPQKWWDHLSNEDKGVIKDLPNFDKDIFKEITGITVE